MTEKNAEQLNRELEAADVTELDEEELDDVAGGANENCHNRDCCASQLE